MARSRQPQPVGAGLVWTMTGPDTALAAALQELAATKFIAAADLLRTTGPASSSDLRCHRLLLMAHAAAPSAAAERWMEEEPGNRDAIVLHARVAVIRALRAHREQHPRAGELTDLARRVCIEAAERSPWDPVPWVARMQLAGLPQPEDPRRDGFVDDPYRLIGEIHRRHEGSREGHHRLLTAVGPDAGGSVIAMFDVARTTVRHAPPGSPLHLLPLLVYLKNFQRKAGSSLRDQVIFADQEWSTAQARGEIADAFERWFASRHRASDVLLPDLHLLAHGLWKANMFAEAAGVFAEIGPYALPLPWSVHGDPKTIFLRARNRCLEHGPPAP